MDLLALHGTSGLQMNSAVLDNNSRAIPETPKHISAIISISMETALIRGIIIVVLLQLETTSIS